MALIKFERTETPSGSVEFSRNPSYGSGEPFRFRQPQDITCGGVVYSYDKGIIEETIELKFEHMPETDYQGMIDFFRNVVKGKSYIFTYLDETGAGHTCMLLNDSINFSKESFGRRAGTLKLRKIT